ncbi:MAG TPA: FKBP-type peptidyl-prolyl cis-trans isomerase [Polyangia bacterium]
MTSILPPARPPRVHRSFASLAALVVAITPAITPAVAAEPRAAAPPSTDLSPIEPLPSAPAPVAPRAPADVAEPPAAATRTDSGLASRVLLKGAGGDHPGAYDQVTVHYTAWTPAGRVIDSSVPRGEASKLTLDKLIAGWSEGVRLMTKGEKRRLWIPANLAAAEGPRRTGASAGPLVMDVELVDFVHMPEPPKVPDDVDAAPADAKRTASGLAYKILRHGKSKQHPTADSAVEVHYSGWTPDGKLFDSSVLRGKPITFGLNGVIKGWTEGLQLMAVGDKARFWIPSKLAYGDKPTRDGAPAGDLVFDVELLGIK